MPTRPQPSIILWPQGAPGALGQGENDTPTLTPYWPARSKATGASIVICPGGGYGGLAPHEGEGYALWLNRLGIAGFVLKYRLGSHGYRHPCMLRDASRAIRLVRAHSRKWKLDPLRIGIMGSSAGGHLASTALTHFDAGRRRAADPIERQSSRPDLGILCYAVITMGANTHVGSRTYLLGGKPSPKLIRHLSNELHVTRHTPPGFIWHTWEDQSVKVENALQLAAAYQRAGVPFDLHVYQEGGHGMGIGGKPHQPNRLHPWTRDCAFWLKVQGFTE